MYGQVIGLLQMSQTSFDTHACDAAFARSLSANGFSLNDANYQQIGIPQAMPTDENQARLMLVMATQAKDSLKYVAATNDFLELFPAATDGYNNRALIEAGAQQWANADETMKNCIRKANDKDEAHYNYAKMMYNYAASGLHWSLDEALAEANEAYKAKPLPIYQHLQAQIIYAKGDYQQALNIFEQLSKDKNFNTPELLYEQAQCKHSLKAPGEEVIVLLDSAINTTDTLRFTEAYSTSSRAHRFTTRWANTAMPSSTIRATNISCRAVSMPPSITSAHRQKSRESSISKPSPTSHAPSSSPLRSPPTTPKWPISSCESTSPTMPSR